jgi:hypothetical protein
MGTHNIRPLLTFGICVWAIFFAGCENDHPPSIFDPNATQNPAPVIRSMAPADSALANVGEITITGENFSAEKDKNLVLFNNNHVTIVSASLTQLIVKSPNIVADSIKVQVAAVGSQLFSAPIWYKLKPAVVPFGRLEEPGKDTYKAFGVDVDREGNVYASVEPNKIKKVAPDGKTTVLNAATTFVRANAIKVGAGNVLYVTNVVTRLRRISTIAPDGAEAVFVSLPGVPQDLDFDANGNIWVTVDSSVYLVKPDKTVKHAATYPVTLATLRVFNGHIYVAGKNATTGEEKIWRSAIQGESLGAKEVVLDVAATGWLQGSSVLSLTFSAAGEMYLGTSHPNGMFILRADGSHEILYEGLISASINAVSWNEGTFLFALQQSATATKLLKIDAAQKGAPYYGRR